MDVSEVYKNEISCVVAQAKERINLSAVGYDLEDLTQDATLAVLEANPGTSKEAYAALDQWYAALDNKSENVCEYWSEQLPDTEDYL